MSTMKLSIKGMNCDHCVRHVTNALATVPGVTVRQVTVGHATVDDNGQPDAFAAIVHALDDIGYEAQLEAA